MTRQFIAALLSLSLGFSAMTTAPARADEDVVKVIAGLALLGILAKSSNDKKKREVVTQRSHKPHHTQRVRPRYTKKVAPRSCLQQQWTHQGVRNVYGARCMQKSVRHALPHTCKRTVDTRKGISKFYSTNCLRQNGWEA